jgi:fission process protein 1
MKLWFEHYLPHDSVGKDDIFRDSLLRYLGYANEIGEALKPVAPAFYYPSYVVAFGYVLGDTLDKSTRASKECDDQRKSGNARAMHIGEAAVDTLVWQTLASVVLPGYTINRVVDATGIALERAKIKGFAARWTPTMAGFAAIPMIIHPIDNLVHWMMDNSIRIRR